MTQRPEKNALFEDLKHVDPLFWEKLRERDPARAAFRTGTVWDGQAYTVELLGRTYRVDPVQETVLCPERERISFQEGLVLLAYLGGDGPGGLAGNRVPLRNLPGGELFFAKTHNPSTDDLAEELGLDADGSWGPEKPWGPGPRARARAPG